MDRHPSRLTPTDFDVLSRIAEALPAEVRPAARWRITQPEWATMCAEMIRYTYPRPIEPAGFGQLDEPWTLYGLPVDVTHPQRYHSPELVISSTRSNLAPLPPPA